MSAQNSATNKLPGFWKDQCQGIGGTISAKQQEDTLMKTGTIKTKTMNRETKESYVGAEKMESVKLIMTKLNANEEAGFQAIIDLTDTAYVELADFSENSSLFKLNENLGSIWWRLNGLFQLREVPYLKECLDMIYFYIKEWEIKRDNNEA